MVISSKPKEHFSLPEESRRPKTQAPAGRISHQLWPGPVRRSKKHNPGLPLVPVSIVRVNDGASGTKPSEDRRRDGRHISETRTPCTLACSEANRRACAQIDAQGGARRAGEEIQVDLERGSSPISAKIKRSVLAGALSSGCVRPRPGQSRSSVSEPAPISTWVRCPAGVGAEQTGTHAKGCALAVGQIS